MSGRAIVLGLLCLVVATLAPSRGEATPRRPRLWPTTRAASKAPASRPASRPAAARGHAARTYRRAVGALGTALCYHAYRSIKSAADGLLRRIYRRADIQQRMAATQRTLRASRRQLGAVARLRLAAVDRLALRQLIGALDQLIGAAAALEGYAKSKTKRDFNRFELRRRAAWRKLRRLLSP